MSRSSPHSARINLATTEYRISPSPSLDRAARSSTSPAFFVDQLTVFAENHTNHAVDNLVLTNVPVIILDVASPDPAATSAGHHRHQCDRRSKCRARSETRRRRRRAQGLFISDPVTIRKELGHCRRQRHLRHRRQLERRHAPPDLANRGIANVRHVSGGNQTAVVAANATVWEAQRFRHGKPNDDACKCRAA